jgi:hypothetical protein
MDASIISAVAALGGAAIGGLTSVLASWLAQRIQARAQWVTHDLVRRQELYKEFIENASKCYVHALQHDEADIQALVGLYAKLGRMRVLSSPKVLASAERIERQIVDTYLAPIKTFLELREMINSGSVNLLREQPGLPRRGRIDQLSPSLKGKQVVFPHLRAEHSDRERRCVHAVSRMNAFFRGTMEPVKMGS